MAPMERRESNLLVRLKPSEREAIDAGAAAAGETVTTFIRSAALKRARSMIRKVQKHVDAVGTATARGVAMGRDSAG